MSHTGTERAIARVTEAQIGAACEAYREAYLAAQAAWRDWTLQGYQHPGLERIVNERSEARDEASRRLLSLLRRQAKEGAGG